MPTRGPRSSSTGSGWPSTRPLSRRRWLRCRRCSGWRSPSTRGGGPPWSTTTETTSGPWCGPRRARWRAGCGCRRSPRRPGGVLILVVVAGLVGGLLRLWAVRWLGRLRRRGPAPPQGPVARQHARAREAYRKRGLGPPAALPPVDAAEWLAQRGPAEAGEAMIALAWLYYDCALGEGRGPEHAAQARGLAERVVRALQDQGTGEA